MKIVVLDGHTLNPGDLSWAALEALGEVVVFPRTNPEEVASRVAGATIVLTNKVVLNRDTILQATALQYIGVTATGYNVVDMAAARERQIVVTNVPAYSTASVAQLTMAFLLELAFHTGQHSQSVRSGDWSAQPDFSYWQTPLIELAGKTFGIIGLGRIGQAVARLALAFGMRVLAVHKHPDRDRMEGVTFTDLETCFRQADVVSLHVPLNADNGGFVNANLLACMKPTAWFINVSRGPLVNEQDLANALNANKLAGAGLDVLSTEPPAPDNPLLTAKNCLITPHIAWATQAARTRLMTVTINNVKSFITGTPVNQVS